MTVELQDAQTRLFELAQCAAQGEEIILAREGKPVARLTPVPSEQPKRRLGGLEHMDYKVPDDFNTMFDKEVEEMFYGSSENE